MQEGLNFRILIRLILLQVMNFLIQAKEAILSIRAITGWAGIFLQLRQVLPLPPLPVLLPRQLRLLPVQRPRHRPVPVQQQQSKE